MDLPSSVQTFEIALRSDALSARLVISAPMRLSELLPVIAEGDAELDLPTFDAVLAQTGPQAVLRLQQVLREFETALLDVASPMSMKERMASRRPLDLPAPATDERTVAGAA